MSAPKAPAQGKNPAVRKKNEHDGHRVRMRERFQKGDSFQQHEALEMLLYATIAQGNTNPLAHQLIDAFGSFSGVFDAPLEELMKVKGIGDKSAFLIKLVPLLARMYSEDKYADGLILNSTTKIGDYLVPKFFGLTVEVTYLLCFDGRCKLLNCVKLSEGSVNATAVNVRRIIEEAVKCGALSVAIGHNHPNGFAIPSDGDILTTRKIINALETIGVQLLDHIIVAGDDYVSLAESGEFAALFRRSSL